MLVLLSQANDLSDLRLGDLERVNTADTFSFRVYLEHDTRCRRAIHAKNALQDLHDELNGRGGFPLVADSSLDEFAGYMVQSLEQAESYFVISGLGLFLIIIIIILII